MGLTGLKNRLLEALKLDGNIVFDRNNLEEAEGYPVEHYERLGLSKSDLKRLAAHGFAIRGYLPERSGHRARWLLLADGNHTQEPAASNSVSEVQDTNSTDSNADPVQNGQEGVPGVRPGHEAVVGEHMSPLSETGSTDSDAGNEDHT